MWHGHFYDYLLCYTCGGLEVDRDGKVLALAGVPSGSPLELNDLMTRLKLPLAQSSQAWLADHARREAALANFRKNEQGWISAGPASLRTFMDLSLNQDAGDLLSKSHLQQMDASFKADVPDAKERIRQLLIWYGSARGTWAGYSPYEQTTEALLADYPTSLVAEVVAARASSSDALAEGAAHYFAGDEFMRRHPGDLRHLSPAIKALLLDHVLHSGDPQDGIRRYRATTAFKQGN
jgi:hypothetical protein